MTTGIGAGDDSPTPPAAVGVHSADFYTGIVPEVYSALRSTTFDAGRHLAFVRRVGEPALELGCGDDGPFLELARLGIDIDGVDSSPDMLVRCRARAAAAGIDVVTYCANMERLVLPRRYRSIYFAGPTFNLLPDDDTARSTLRGIAAHLLPGGEALVPLWIPPATPPQEFGVTREATTASSATARYTVEAEDFDDVARSRRTRTCYELISGGQREFVRREWVIHWHTPAGFAALAEDAGLAVTAMSPVQDREFTARLRGRAYPG